MQKLFTILGKGQHELQQTECGYRTVIYCRPGSTANIETPFVGEAIVRLFPELVDEIHILGTQQAMWNQILRHAMVDFDDWNSMDAATQDWLQACDLAVKDGQTCPDMQRLAGELSLFLERPTFCHIIPMGLDQEELAEIACTLDSLVQAGDMVHLDITHGLRFQPLIIRKTLGKIIRTKGAQTGETFYGALELPEARSAFRPLLRLASVLR